MKNSLIRAGFVASLGAAVVLSGFGVITPQGALARTSLMQEDKRPHDATLRYLQACAEGNLMEIKAGNLAKEKGNTQAVKDYGAMLVSDHTANLEKLKALAMSKNITLKEEITDKQQKAVDKLTGLSGRDFDRMFINHMIADHEADIHESEGAAKKVDDPDVKSYAETNITAFQAHLDKAKEIKKTQDF